MTTLYAFAGLPGVGKSALAQQLARAQGAAYLRIDTLEQALRDRYGDIHDEGYQLAYRVAADNLALGIDVVADSCNPLCVTREAWARVARQWNSRAVDIEVVCSDRAVHRKRIESRVSEVPGLRLPDWDAVMAREYEPWATPRIVIDTAGQSIDASFRELTALV